MICARDQRTRHERAADLLAVLASRGIYIRPGPTPGMVKVRYDRRQMTEELKAEIKALKPELLARLRIGRMGTYPGCVRLRALGWSDERINAVVLEEGEMILDARNDYVRIIGGQRDERTVLRWPLM